MADCCKGNRTASAVTVRCRVVFSTVATCTGTTGSFSAVSLEQLERNDKNKSAAQNTPRSLIFPVIKSVLPRNFPPRFADLLPPSDTALAHHRRHCAPGS